VIEACIMVETIGESIFTPDIFGNFTFTFTWRVVENSPNTKPFNFRRNY